MDEMIYVKEAAMRWHLTARRVSEMCKNGQIAGVKKQGRSWLIPADTPRPQDHRVKSGAYKKQNRKPGLSLPIGVSDYRLAQEYYYVDKTLMIKDFLDERPMVSLFTRPRRFGKTLNMDMLRTFFEKTEEDTSLYFRDKKIWACGEKYRAFQGKYPVIFISFKDVKKESWTETYRSISENIALEFKRHAELNDPQKNADYHYYLRVVDGTADRNDLLGLNGGIDERTGEHVGPQMEPVGDGPIDFEDAWKRFNIYLAWLCELYVNIMNIIHFMHDRYDYESAQMAFLNSELKRLMAFGVAGFSVAADSLSAIKYAKVYPIRDENGVIVDYRTEGDFPKYGNDDDRVDDIAVKISERTIEELRKHPTYRNAVHTLSVLTITSNVMYGKKTGNTPDGRRAGTPFAPGANPMHQRDNHGAIASLNSVSKIDWDTCQDGVSNTFSITPETLGKNPDERADVLAGLLEGYFKRGAHHLNVNVLNRALLEDAYENPDKYPNLTVRVSGYAVRFNALSKTHQKEVIARTFHEAI